MRQINVFELLAKLSFDSGDFDKGVDKAAQGFDDLGDSAAEVSSDTAKAEAAIDKLADAVAEATDDTHGMSAEAQANAQQVKMLGKQYLEAKAKVDSLSKEYVETARATGETSDETQELSRKLQEAQAECKSYADQLEELEDAFGGASGGTKSFGDSIANAVLKGNLMTEGASALWNGVKQVASAVWNMDKATEEYRVAQGKLNTAFEAAGYSSNVAQQSYRAFYSILGDTDTATEASQLLAQLATNEQDFSTWADIAAGVSGTFGDSLPIEGLIEAANETAKVGQVTGVLADALNWVGISEDEFNQKLAQCATTEERTALITDTLAGKYQDATKIFKENNDVLIKARENQARLQEAQAKLGEETSRLKTALGSALAPAMEKIYNWCEKLMGGMADVAEEWAQTTNDIARPLKTDNIEEAREEVEAMRLKVEELRAATMTLGDSYSTLYDDLALAEAEYKNGKKQLEELEEQERNTAEAANEAAEATDKITVSAAGMTIELENSGLTAEEAAERVNTYTDAATNMFSRINTESEISYEQGLANMQHNIEATQAFGDNMAQIAQYLPQEMADMFAAGGPEMYAGIVAMLAEANAGADPGLTQLREKFAEGGVVAVQAMFEAMGLETSAFTEENPAKSMAETLDSDVSAEQAATDVVTRTVTAMQNTVNSGGFDSAGRVAMNRFINGMYQRQSAVMAAASSIANAAVNAINAALANAAANASSYAGSYRAGGLDYVPYNGYPSVLHRGEAVLTASEADDWRRGRRGGSNTSGITIIQNIEAVPQTPAEFAATTAAYFERARWAI